MVVIPIVRDLLTDLNRLASDVLPTDTNDLSLLRSRIQRERKKSANRLVCGFCRDPVYVNNSGSPHFSHYIDSGPKCPWHTLTPERLADISARRFQGRQVSELHIRLVLAIEEVLGRCSNASNIGQPDQTYFGVDSTGHRFPDLQAVYSGQQLVFELQLSSTYLPVVSDREAFYRENNAFLIWLFHKFKDASQRQTEKDITALRSRQVFEIDDETLRCSLDANDLVVRCHWQSPVIDGDKMKWCWTDQIVQFSEIQFDEYLIEARIVDPWNLEAQLLGERHKEVISKFEDYWFDRHNTHRDIMRREAERLEQGLQWRKDRMPAAILGRAFCKLCVLSENAPVDYSTMDKLGFDSVLDRLYFIRDGVNKFNGQSMIGAVHTIIDRWPHFCDAALAMLVAYGHSDIACKESVSTKVMKKLECNSGVSQCHDYDRLLSFLFPKAASYFRNSCIPFLLRRKRKSDSVS